MPDGDEHVGDPTPRRRTDQRAVHQHESHNPSVADLRD
jgi:hypothetical protein